MTRKEKDYWEASSRIVADFLRKLDIGVDLPFNMILRKELMDLQSGEMVPVTITIYGKRHAEIECRDMVFGNAFIRIAATNRKCITNDIINSSVILATYLKAYGDDIERETKERIECLQSILP